MEGHRCTVCDKCFPSGRSLGGHMRSHVPPPGAGHLSPAPPGNPRGYCLRENPKKKRLYALSRDCPSPAAEKQCRECGELFQSWRSLFGHMSCHSRRSSMDQDDQQENNNNQEGSWSSHEIGDGPIVPKRKRGSNQAAERTSCDLKLEEAAIALMMLCRGIRDCASASNFFQESSDKNSFVLTDDAEDLASDSSVRANGYLWNGVNKSVVTDYWIDPSDESKKMKSCASDASDEELILKHNSIEKSMNLDRSGLGKESSMIKMESFDAYDAKFIRDYAPPDRRSRYQCSSCNRVFQTYQALGGHRASHKRLKGSCSPDAGDGSENNIEMNVSISLRNETGYGSSMKIKSHECFICGKSFQSGQALGGHKRSHLAMISSDGIASASQEAPVILDLIDLNLPASLDGDSTS